MTHNKIIWEIVWSKRQIFREQVLPHSGGKIPESAFRTDRLALNKLQKLGVAVPDGVSLDTRPNSVSTYLIRPPIGSYRPPDLHVHRAVQGPPLGLTGASVEASVGLPPPQPPYPAYQQLPDIPPPTPEPEHYRYVTHGGLSNALQSVQHNPTLNFNRGYNNNLYTHLISGYRPNGLLHLTTPHRASFNPYSFLNFPSVPYGGLRVGHEGNHGSASETSTSLTAAPVTSSSFRCDVPGREMGKVYADPLTNCKKQYICLEDGRAADYICPEGSVFDHRQGKCETRRFRRRRVKLDANCEPVL
ncbi:hypothetical protein B566_EDAN012323 [Ephemera danica]|nr:hypothetical protein B566_EDAN012323 [Ephemera danica]